MMDFDLTPENIVQRDDGSFIVKIIGGDLDGKDYQTTPTYNRELYVRCCVALNLPIPPEATEEAP